MSELDKWRSLYRDILSMSLNLEKENEALKKENKKLKEPFLCPTCGTEIEYKD